MTSPVVSVKRESRDSGELQSLDEQENCLISSASSLFFFLIPRKPSPPPPRIDYCSALRNASSIAMSEITRSTCSLDVLTTGAGMSKSNNLRETFDSEQPRDEIFPPKRSRARERVSEIKLPIGGRMKPERCITRCKQGKLRPIN